MGGAILSVSCARSPRGGRLCVVFGMVIRRAGLRSVWDWAGLCGVGFDVLMGIDWIVGGLGCELWGSLLRAVGGCIFF